MLSSGNHWLWRSGEKATQAIRVMINRAKSQSDQQKHGPDYYD